MPGGSLTEKGSQHLSKRAVEFRCVSFDFVAGASMLGQASAHLRWERSLAFEE